MIGYEVEHTSEQYRQTRMETLEPFHAKGYLFCIQEGSSHRV